MKYKAMLKRLTSLYGVVEVASLGEVSRRRMLTAEVEEALELDEEAIRASSVEHRKAMLCGDRTEQVFAEIAMKLIERNREKLELALESRAQLLTAAVRQYANDQLRSKQMKLLHEDAIKREQASQGKRLQAAMDERFLLLLRKANAEALRRGDIHRTM